MVKNIKEELGSPANTIFLPKAIERQKIWKANTQENFHSLINTHCQRGHHPPRPLRRCIPMLNIVRKRDHRSAQQCAPRSGILQSSPRSPFTCYRRSRKSLCSIAGSLQLEGRSKDLLFALLEAL